MKRDEQGRLIQDDVDIYASVIFFFLVGLFFGLLLGYLAGHPVGRDDVLADEPSDITSPRPRIIYHFTSYTTVGKMEER